MSFFKIFIDINGPRTKKRLRTPGLMEYLLKEGTQESMIVRNNFEMVTRLRVRFVLGFESLLQGKLCLVM